MHTIDLPKQEREPNDPDVSSLYRHNERTLACKIKQSHTFPQTHGVQAKGTVSNISGIGFETGHLNDVCKEYLVNLSEAIMTCRCVEGKIPQWHNEPIKSLFQNMREMITYTPCIAI